MSLNKIILYSLMVLFFIGCASNGKEGGGGGTETGDPGASAGPISGLISGKTVLDKNSNITIENVTLWLDDDASKKSYSIEEGKYLIENLSSGKHEIYARWKNDDILLVGKSEVFEIGEIKGFQKPFIYLGQNIILTNPAQLTGLIVSDSLNLTVSLNNSIFKTKVLSNGVFEINELPAGLFLMEIKQFSKVIFSKEIELVGGETLDLGLLNLD